MITFKNHHFWDVETSDPDVSPEAFAYEMVAEDRIIHIYQIMPEMNVICVEYLGYDGVVRMIHECFVNKFHAALRMFELQRLLKGEKS